MSNVIYKVECLTSDDIVTKIGKLEESFRFFRQLRNDLVHLENAPGAMTVEIGRSTIVSLDPGNAHREALEGVLREQICEQIDSVIGVLRDQLAELLEDTP